MVTTERASQQIRFENDIYFKLSRYPVCKRNSQHQQKVLSFREYAKQTLFAIASCKCAYHTAFSCAKEKKVISEQRNFLHVCDQRTVRKVSTASTDGPRTKQ